MGESEESGARRSLCYDARGFRPMSTGKVPFMRTAWLWMLAVPVVAASLGACGDFQAGGGENGDDGGTGADGGGIVQPGDSSGGSADGSSGDGGGAHHDASSSSSGSSSGSGGGDASTSSSGADASSSGGGSDGGNDGGTTQPDAPTGCPTGQLDCGGSCVPNDVHNCGACGHSCTSLAHVSGTTSCTADKCAFPESACAPGWSDCDGKPDNGCETDITTSSHCGSCSTSCPSGNVCQASGCTPSCSAPTPTLCGGTCTDTTSDPQHCGSCNATPCSGVTNGQPACKSSACSFTCNSGFTGCPTSSPTACVDEQGDTQNCGSCGNVCPAPVTAGSGTAVCSSGKCGLNCAASLTACPAGAPKDCVNEATDKNNCGSCGNVCSQAPTNGTAACHAGACGFDCNPGYAVCNNSTCAQQADPSGVFVSTHGGGSACTYASPCGSISTGASVAASNGKSYVYVESGQYTETVTLQGGSGITIDGGWTLGSGTATGTWTRCNQGVATISTSSADRVVVLGSGTWNLTNINVANQTVAAPGQTLYGVFATGGSLTISGSVSVAAAGDGAPGAANTGSGNAGQAGGCSPASTGSAGSTGSLGAHATITYGPSGPSQSPATSGGTGGTGANGTQGPDGSPGGCSDCAYNSGDGSCDCTVANGPPGLGGCPGTGGPGGGPGGSGGSSIGVFAWAGTVSVGSIQVGKGGDGGNGGGGGAGGKGAAGAQGPSACIKGCAKTSPTKCALSNPCTTDTGGSAGGNGGNGGPGGQGGGGAGGDSYCYYANAGASVTGGCSAAAAGKGGNAATADPAPNGHSGTHP